MTNTLRTRTLVSTYQSPNKEARLLGEMKDSRSGAKKGGPGHSAFCCAKKQESIPRPIRALSRTKGSMWGLWGAEPEAPEHQKQQGLEMILICWQKSESIHKKNGKLTKWQEWFQWQRRGTRVCGHWGPFHWLNPAPHIPWGQNRCAEMWFSVPSCCLKQRKTGNHPNT